MKNLMKLNEIASKPDGTYVGVKYDRESCKIIKQLALDLGVPNRITSDKIHSTVIYSRKYVPELKANNDIYPMNARGLELTIFDTRDGKRALVLKLKCQRLVDRHNQIMSEYQTTYDYPEYVPHITLSYDCGDFDPKSYKGELPKLTIDEEYVEDLVLDWQNKPKKKKEEPKKED